MTLIMILDVKNGKKNQLLNFDHFFTKSRIFEKYIFYIFDHISETILDTETYNTSY